MLRSKLLLNLFALSALLLAACQNQDQLLNSANPEDAATLAKATASSNTLSGETLYGMTTSNKLLTFNSAAPRTILSSVRLSGLQPDEELLAIDFRPANGKLYGLGSTSRLYVIDVQTGAATVVGSGPFSPGLLGNAFGFDFNPTVDRIRIVSETGQNLRLHPDLGTVIDFDPATPGTQTDGNLAYASTDVNFNRKVVVAGAAYTNPDNDPATGTTLYDICASRDVLAIQNPPNNGVLNTVGTLGFNFEKLVGFDISKAGIGYATVKAKNRSNGYSDLVTVNLSTGLISRIDIIGTSEPIRGLAVPVQ